MLSECDFIFWRWIDERCYENGFTVVQFRSYLFYLQRVCLKRAPFLNHQYKNRYTQPKPILFVRSSICSSRLMQSLWCLVEMLKLSTACSLLIRLLNSSHLHKVKHPHIILPQEITCATLLCIHPSPWRGFCPQELLLWEDLLQLGPLPIHKSPLRF